MPERFLGTYGPILNFQGLGSDQDTKYEGNDEQQCVDQRLLKPGRVAVEQTNKRPYQPSSDQWCGDVMIQWMITRVILELLFCHVTGVDDICKGTLDMNALKMKPAFSMKAVQRK